MIQLNEAQKAAVAQTTGNLLILAGPGTGKTRVIVSKIEELVRQGLSPESILAVTFSRKATQEMEDRISDLSPGIAQRMSIKTLHALSAEIVQAHGFRLGFQKPPRLLSEAEGYVLFKGLAPRLPLQSLLKTPSIDSILQDLLNFFADCKDEGLWPESILRYAEEIQSEEWQGLGDIYNAYQSYCFEKGFLDFGDCVLCALRILEEFPEVRAPIQSRYRAILVDEFQDTNWSQIRLLRLMTAPDAHMAAVGDDDQSIYRFRGASYSAFKFFDEAFENSTVVELNETYRLPVETLQLASKLIQANGQNRFRPDKKIISQKESQLPNVWIKSDSYEAEAAEIADIIQALRSKGSSFKEMAILVRAHSHAEFIIEELRARNLPIRLNSTKSLLNTTIIRDVFAILRLCVDPTDSVSFLRVMSSPLIGLSSDEIYAFCRWKNPKAPLIDQIEKIDEATISTESKSKLLSFYKIYIDIYAESARMGPNEILLKVYSETALVQKLLKSAPAELRALGRFHSELVRWEQTQNQKDLRTLLPILESIQENEFSMDNDGGETEEDAISILTVHASKGLEFDYVFIPSLVGRRFPSNFNQNLWLVPDSLRKEAAPTKESHIQEERRLLYVAMTRAKKQLTISSIEKKGTRPSFFVSEDLKDLLSNPKIVQMRTPPVAGPSPIPRNLQPKPQATFPLNLSTLEKKRGPLSLSFTQLEKYESCPLAYQFKYEFQIPVSIPAHMHIGSAIHKALEIFFQRIKSQQTATREDLILEFEKAFKDLKEANPELTEFHLNQGREKLGAYYDFHQGRFPFPHDIEASFVLPLGEHKIRGKIDRIDRLNDGYRIVDYKTGRSKSNENPEDVRFAKESLQFSIYALAARDVLKLEVRDLVFDYVYDQKTLSTQRSPKELAATQDKIHSIAENILNGNFDPTPGRHCDWCEYRRVCPAI